MQMKISSMAAVFSPFRSFRVLVGFSGGADSSALLLLAEHFAGEFDFDLTAVHFNHHLRGVESDIEAEKAAEFASRRGIKFHKEDIYPAPGNGVEARAREERLKVWKRLCANDPRCVVMLGHHADDRIENFFLRMGRGSNSGGLCGLRQEYILEGVHFFRPLFSWRRKDVEDFLRSGGVFQWAEDSSNFQNDAVRNILRNRILPELYNVLPGGDAGVCRSLDNLEKDADFLEQEALEKFNSGDLERTGFWKSLHPALFCRVFRKYLDAFYGEMMPVSADSLERFSAAVSNGKNAIVPLSGKRELRIVNGKIFCTGSDGFDDGKVLWKWHDEKSIRWNGWHFSWELRKNIPEELSYFDSCFDMDLLPEELCIRAIAPGDRMKPFKSEKTVKLKTLRIDRKIPAYPPSPVVIGDERIIWAPGIRHSGEFTVVENGKKIIFMRAEPDKTGGIQVKNDNKFEND